MRIARSAALTMTVLLSSAVAMAQPQPTAPKPAPAPAPLSPAASEPAAASPTAPQPPTAPGVPVAPTAPPAAAATTDAGTFLDAPPAPSPPGSKVSQPEPPPALPKAFPIEFEVNAIRQGPPLAGWHGGFFLRDSNDNFRLYPRGRLQVDFNSFLGPGVNEVAAIDGGNAVKNRLLIRRARFELAGTFLQRWSFHMSIEAGGQPISNANGRTQTAASKAGEEPTADTARWAGVQTTIAAASLADNWINYSICPCLNFMAGQFDVPFSMENRTSDTVSAWMEGNLAIRGFVVPSKKDMALTVWGEFGERNLNYEVGVSPGDGQNRPQVDNAVDFLGRVFALPFAKKDSKSLLNKAQIGLSARHGTRDQAYVGYAYPAITSGQGFALWDPRYKDSQGHNVQIIPSGAQNAIGGELRLPLSIFELRSEAYYVVNNTREAVEGYQLTNTERLGSVKGIGWYAQVALWPLGDAYVYGDPGFMRPTKVDLSKDPGKPKRGLELLAIIANVNADYSGAAREGTFDTSTPGASGSPAKVSIFEYGFGANYWHTRHIRASLNYIVYHTPGSGSADNLAQVPGNLVKDTKASAHVLHELSTRLGLAF